MSELETNVKPILSPLMRGEACTLEQDAQSILAKWVAMKVIAAEHDQPELIMTPEQDRRALREHGRVPSYFDIRLGFHSLDVGVGYFRRATTMMFGPLEMHTPLPTEAPIKNFQDVHFLVGKLLVVAAASRSNRRVDEIFGVVDALPRIWPSIDKELIWPPSKCLSPQEIQRLAGRLDSLERQNRSVWLPHPGDPIEFDWI